MREDEKKYMIQKLQRQIAFGEGQFAIFQAHAMSWQAQIVSGAYKLRNTAQGREPTEEERAKGITIGWRDHSDDEKLQNAIQTMNRHIHNMSECNDNLDGLRERLNELL